MAAANLGRDTEPRLALAAAPLASKVSHRGRPPLCEIFGAGPVAAKASRWLLSRRKGLEAGVRRRANFGHDPQLTACREVARTHQGLHGGHPGDHHAAPPVSCVSVMPRMSATECASLPVHSTCAEGAHVSPPTLGTSSGTGRTVPSPMARSGARLLTEGALRGRVTAICGVRTTPKMSGCR